jgi:hypothetical protein
VTAKLFWPGVVVGWSLIAVGLVGIAGEGRDVPVGAFGRWIVGPALVHDLVVAPAVILIGVVVARLLRPPWRSIAAAALIVAGPVVLFAWPYVAGWGRSGANASVQPRDYGFGLAVLLAAVGATAVLLALIEVVRRARARPRSVTE